MKKLPSGGREAEVLENFVLVDDLSLDQVGGTALADGHAGGNDHSITGFDEAFLLGGLHTEGEETERLNQESALYFSC